MPSTHIPKFPVVDPDPSLGKAIGNFNLTDYRYEDVKAEELFFFFSLSFFRLSHPVIYSEIFFFSRRVVWHLDFLVHENLFVVPIHDLIWGLVSLLV